MAIHPDDPPWDIFDLPRIVGREEDYDRLFKAVPNKHNGITFCTGSLGAGRFNDLPQMAAKYADRIYFAHLRQLKFVNDTDFYENGHQTQEGNVDIYAIVKALVENGFNGYLRPITAETCGEKTQSLDTDYTTERWAERICKGCLKRWKKI